MLEALRVSLETRPNAVVVAEPGAGKSTRVPPFLALTHLLAPTHQRILVLQPRRVAVFGLAKRIAEEQEWQLGEKVGYQVRLDKKSTASTQVELITEGILIRRLLKDPELKGIGCVILDEFHERNLFSDLAIAWLKEVQSAVRPDLRIVVMSATLDSEKVRDFLAPCEIFRSPGRLHPLKENYSRKSMVITGGRPLVERVMEVLFECTTAPDDDGGDILVFLPGIREIRGCLEAATSSLALKPFRVLSLSGNQKWEEQKEALVKSSVRRVIFSTNIAETSLTINGVTTVIDSGLQNVLRYNSKLGVSGLRTEKISRASAKQRGGRAGREAPGRVFHLWTKSEENTFAPFLEPEIARVDLSETLLQLTEWGVKDPRTFTWFESPPETHLREAQARLRMLGCLETDGSLTELGKSVLRWPLTVRWAVFLEEVLRGTLSADGLSTSLWIAAMLQERNLISEGFPGSDFSSYKDDLSLRLEAQARRIRLHPWWNQRTAEQVGLSAKDLARIAGRGDVFSGRLEHMSEEDWRGIRRALVVSHPDRVVRRRTGTQKGVMVGGRGVQIDSGSVVAEGDFWLALSLREVDGSADLRSDINIPVDLEDLGALKDLFQSRDEVKWNEALGRPQKVSGRYLMDLMVEGPTARDLSATETAGALREVVFGDTRRFLEASPGYGPWLLRLGLARARYPEMPWPDPAVWMPEVIEAWLGDNLKSLEVLKDRPFPPFVEMFWSREMAGIFHKEFPEVLEVPSGSRIPLTYFPEKNPVLSVRLQEVFGWSESPRIGGGQLKVTLELLGPNYRPLQTTGDLRSFWSGVYQEVRKELRARYPKHSWPEDPLTAQAVAKGRSRR